MISAATLTAPRNHTPSTAVSAEPTATGTRQTIGMSMFMGTIFAGAGAFLGGFMAGCFGISHPLRYAVAGGVMGGLMGVGMVLATDQ